MDSWTHGPRPQVCRKSADELGCHLPPRSVGFLIRKDSRWGKITFDKLPDTLHWLSSGGLRPCLPSQALTRPLL